MDADGSRSRPSPTLLALLARGDDGPRRARRSTGSRTRSSAARSCGPSIPTTRSSPSPVSSTTSPTSCIPTTTPITTAAAPSSSAPLLGPRVARPRRRARDREALPRHHRSRRTAAGSASRSVETLAVQGDALADAELAALAADPDLAAILDLRRADERAKDPDALGPRPRVVAATARPRSTR